MPRPKRLSEINSSDTEELLVAVRELGASANALREEIQKTKRDIELVHLRFRATQPYSGEKELAQTTNEK